MGSCKRCPRNRIYGHVQCNGRRSEEGLTEPINSRTSLEYGRFVVDANKVYAKLLPACLPGCLSRDGSAWEYEHVQHISGPIPTTSSPWKKTAFNLPMLYNCYPTTSLQTGVRPIYWIDLQLFDCCHWLREERTTAWIRRRKETE